MTNLNSGKTLSRRAFMQAVGLGTGVLACSPAIAGTDEAPFALEHGPCLQTPGTNEMTVTWHTNRVGVPCVDYGLGELVDLKAVPSHAGLIPNDSTCHAVRLTGLQPGTTYRYKATTREFLRYKTPYVVEYGGTVESDTLTFTTLNPAKPAFSFLMWNDIHDDAKRLKAMFNEASWDGVDFVVLNGDIINDFVRPEQPFRGFYDACVERFAQTLPMVYVRGNHETRGPMARRFADYFPGQGGRYNWSFDHGPAHFVVLDSGEDKPDSSDEYAGLVDFGPYREEQAAWLRADLASEAARNAKFRIVLSHQPSLFASNDEFAGQEIRRLWDPIINAAGAHLWLSGHFHDFAERPPHENGGENTYHAIVNPKDGTTRVDVTADVLRVTVTQPGGNVLKTVEILA